MEAQASSAEHSIIPHFINSVSETLLITLYARAVESRRRDALLVDPIAEHMIDQLDYDFSHFDKKNTQTAVAIRARYFDDNAMYFIQSNKDAHIISLGSGLDTRNHRLLDQGYRAAQFIDVDFADVIASRAKLIPAMDNNLMIPTSALNNQWMQDLSAQLDGKPVFIIAEGLFMYLTHQQIQQLLNDLQTYFPNAQLLFDATVPWYSKMKQETVRHTHASFASGISRPMKFGYENDMKLIAARNVWQLYPNRWGLLGKVAQFIRPLRNVHQFLLYQFH